MIRIGVCASPEHVEFVAGCGFDYMETSLAGIASMEDEAFEALVRKVDTLPIRIESYNGMLPGELKVTGENVNAQALHDYLKKAFDRARRLGGKVVVFGSSASRNVPSGFPYEVAWRQIGNFLRLAEKHAAENDIRVAIEPLRRAESNVINLVSEAMILTSLVNMPHIGVLADTYHMAMTSEPYSVFGRCDGRLYHVHTANAMGRVYPRPGDGENYRKMFASLKEAGYDGRVSIEAGCSDFEKDAPEALRALREALK